MGSSVNVGNAVHKSLIFAVVLTVGIVFAFTGTADAQSASDLTVEPSVDLVDHQDVEVSASVTSQHGPLLIRQCPAGAEQTSECDSVILGAVGGGHGTGLPLPAIVQVFREIDLPSGSHDCAIDACILALSTFQGGSLLSSAALSFDPTVPARPRPSAVAAPATDLMEGELIQITGEGYAPFERLWVAQCSSVVEYGCGRQIRASAELDGTFQATFKVTRILENIGIGGYDCASSTCLIRVYRSSGRSPAPVALQFDPDAPTEPGSTVKVRPRKNLLDGDVVDVSVLAAEGVKLNRYASLYQCGLTESGAIDNQTCRYSGGFQKSDGTLSGKIQVRQSIFVENQSGMRRVDCLEQRCVLVNNANQTYARSQVLKFDAASVVPKPVVKIGSRNGLVAGKRITLTLRNTRTHYVEVRQCPRGATTHLDHRGQNIGGHYRGPTAETPGVGLESFKVRPMPVRFVGTGDTKVDCYEPQACDLRVFGYDGPMRRLLVNFGSEQPPLTEKFRLAKRNDLANRETVAIKVGIKRGGWTLEQCPNLDNNFGCERIRLANQKKENGVTRGTVSLPRIINGVDCAVTTCQLRLLKQHRETFRVELGFDAEVPGDPQPEFSTKPRRGLVDGQTVVVTGSAVGSQFYVTQCARDDEGVDTTCRYLDVVRNRKATTPKTRILEVNVLRLLGETDCAESAGRCRLVFSDGHTGRTLGSENLRFDAEAELPGSTVRVRPRKGLADRQLVTFSVPAAPRVVVRQCVRLDGRVLTDSCRGLSIKDRVQGDESTSGTVRVTRFVGPKEAMVPYDCASSPRTCVLRISTAGERGQFIAETDISLIFDPDAEPVAVEPSPSVATLTVATEGPLAVGDTVVVRGEGFSPGLPLFVLSCPENFEEVGEDCDTSNLTPTTVDSSGGFSVEVVVVGCETERCRFFAGDGQTEQAFTEPFEVLR